MLFKTLTARTLLPLFAVAGMATVAFVSTTGAQSSPASGATRIAVINPNKVFSDMQETKDLNIRLENETKNLAETERQKGARVQELQEGMKLLKPDTDQYAAKNRDLMQAVVEFRAWQEIQKQEMQTQRKQQMRALFDKVQSATAQVAAQRGYDLVIADQRVEFPENMSQATIEQVLGTIRQRNVLYATPAVDISGDVTAFLDTQYKLPK